MPASRKSSPQRSLFSAQGRQILKDLATLSERARLSGDAELSALLRRQSAGDVQAMIELRPVLAQLRLGRSPWRHGQRVVASYRVAPFFADEILTVHDASNDGTVRKPFWRVFVESPRGVSGWLDGDTLRDVEADEGAASHGRPRMDFEAEISAITARSGRR